MHFAALNGTFSHRFALNPPKRNNRRLSILKTKKNISDYVLSIVIFVTMALVLITTIYPFLNSIAISFNHADDTTRGGITFYPRQFTLRNYELIFTNAKIFNAYGITILRTVIGTVTGLFFTSILAFGLAHKNLVGRKFYTMFCLIPMYFGGGLIPTYFLIKSLGLTNSFWVYIIPNLVNLWNMILMRSYFSGIPDALEESAKIDGANYITTYFKIIFPISTPIVATICLFIAVSHWNAWFDSNLYITNEKLKPMQTILLSIVNEARYAEQIAATAGGAVDMGNIGMGKASNVRSITMATMIVTILPIVIVYPLIQRYFIKGIMVGSIKG